MEWSPHNDWYGFGIGNTGQGYPRLTAREERNIINANERGRVHRLRPNDIGPGWNHFGPLVRSCGVVAMIPVQPPLDLVCAYWRIDILTMLQRFRPEHNRFWRDAHRIGENRREGLPRSAGINPYFDHHQHQEEDVLQWMLDQHLLQVDDMGYDMEDNF